jgi:hypothetical protein
MTKNLFLLAGVAGAALALAACTPPTPRHRGGDWGEMKVISKLECPDSQGALKRQSAAADGRTCVYADSSSSEVTLQMVSLEGTDAETALAPLETQLKAELPPRSAKSDGARGGSDGDKDTVNIDLPGVHIHAKGDRGADIEAGHVDINAGDDGAHVRVRKDERMDQDGKTVSVDSHDDHGGVTVDANDSGAEIHVDAGRHHNTRLTVILVSEVPGPHGYKLAGYEARGPRDGPLVVASVKARTEQRDSLYHDMRALVARNVGG